MRRAVALAVHSTHRQQGQKHEGPFHLSLAGLERAVVSRSNGAGY